MTTHPTENLSILLVDDDDVAAEAVERSLRKHAVRSPLVWAEDGLVALQILRGEHPSKKVVTPCIVLLDLNMPRMNGFEFLEQLRSDPAIKRTVVFVLTTSGSDSDRHRAYEHHIAGYMVKSAVGPQFARLTRLLLEYSGAVKLPEGPE